MSSLYWEQLGKCDALWLFVEDALAHLPVHLDTVKFHTAHGLRAGLVDDPANVLDKILRHVSFVVTQTSLPPTAF